MPIKIPDDLPARRVLEGEGVEIIDSHQALRQDIRPLRILLLNLMPKKVQTEIQLARLLSHTPLQVDLTLLTTSTYTPSNISPSHLKTFYKTHREVMDEKFDGLVITGAPVERMAFEDVDYWAELRGIFEWSRRNVTRSLNICWGAQAALYHEFGIPKFELPQKAFGVFEQDVVAQGRRTLLGFPERFPMPVSRHTETRRADVEAHAKLAILIESADSGVAVIEHNERGDLYVFNHFEYDLDTLRQEYQRDVEAGMDIQLPANYFPNDDPAAEPRNIWRPYGYLIFGNWISALYQDTPFDIEAIGAGG
ncbi:MAG: homoserine O-succinyltransferase [Alphaproteobacteria bacterium]|nr:homoserine O-succinyltransferase [Alphaproteobacteria bacterium]